MSWNKIKQSGAVALLTLGLGLGIGFEAAGPLQTVHSQNAVDSETALLRDVYNKANPSVVSINVRLPGGSTNGNASPFGQPRGQQQQPQPYAYAAGSGFVYDTA